MSTQESHVRGPLDRQNAHVGSHDFSSKGGSRVAEVAGVTTAECAAVCCCCPCGAASLAFLAVYKVPVGLCRKAIKRKRRHRLMKKRLMSGENDHHHRCNCGCDDTEIQFHSIAGPEADMLVKSLESNDDLDMEMWQNFDSTGFWRSHSKNSKKIDDVKFYESE